MWKCRISYRKDDLGIQPQDIIVEKCGNASSGYHRQDDE
jgi:hypothetical protein